MTFRSFLFPVVNIGTKLGYIVLILGLFMEFFDMFLIGIALVGLGLLFQLVTLPVEFDASERAKKYLFENGVIDGSEKTGVAKMLGAAAMTYVAGVISSALDLLRLIMLFNRRD